jgi:hypothetical protein
MIKVSVSNRSDYREGHIMNTSRLLSAVSMAALALAAIGFASNASADVSVGIYANVPAPYYYAPPPPPPIVYEPVYEPRVYYQPRPYYAPPPVVYVQPGWQRGDWRGRREWRRERWEHDRWEHGRREQEHRDGRW